MNFTNIVIFLTFTVVVIYCRPELTKEFALQCRSVNGDTSKFFEEKLNNSLECLKKYIKNGYGGVPSFDPWINDTKKIKFEGTYVTLNLDVTNSIFTGLSSYSVDELNLDSVTLKQETRFTFPKLRITADYIGDMNYLGLVHIDGEGTIDIEFTNIKLGTNLQYQMTPPLYKDFSFITYSETVKVDITGIYGDEELSIWFSDQVKEFFLELLNENTEMVSDHLSPKLLELANAHFDKMAFLDYLALISSIVC